MTATPTPPTQSAWDVAASVLDPEVPVLTIADLGILRDVDETDDGVVVTITPTYSGCPAMDAIRDDVRRRVRAGGTARRTRGVGARRRPGPPTG